MCVIARAWKEHKGFIAFFLMTFFRSAVADFGFFPCAEVMGKAGRVAYSLNPDHYYFLRYERIGRVLD
ncbi:hypothetical protein [Paraburkholderia bannensis]|uniref:hypothetical protein n=1 Tax=Paraburkholderia bannensis TaxID=765414 RepID=UPI002AB73176|nr:hypothetical protein [Paraburkholderia bannensis]